MNSSCWVEFRRRLLFGMALHPTTPLLHCCLPLAAGSLPPLRYLPASLRRACSCWRYSLFTIPALFCTPTTVFDDISGLLLLGDCCSVLDVRFPATVLNMLVVLLLFTAADIWRTAWNGLNVRPRGAGVTGVGWFVSFLSRGTFQVCRLRGIKRLLVTGIVGRRRRRLA